MGQTDVRLSRSTHGPNDGERCRRSLQHCRRWRRDCVQLTCWRHGLHHYDDDLWPRPLVLPTLTSSLPLSLLASKFRPTNAPHLVALPLMKRPGASNASPWVPLGPRAQQRIPHDLLIFARPASVFGPVHLPPCILQRPPRPFPGAWHGLPVVLQWAPHGR